MVQEWGHVLLGQELLELQSECIMERLACVHVGPVTSWLTHQYQLKIGRRVSVKCRLQAPLGPARALHMCDSACGEQSQWAAAG